MGKVTIDSFGRYEPSEKGAAAKVSEIESAFKNVAMAAAELERALLPFEKLINGISDCPFKEMGLSERLRVAKLLIAARGQ